MQQDESSPTNYCQWSDAEHWELIDGIAYAMTAPARIHQDMLLEIAVQIKLYLQDKPCKIYVAPSDVRLPEQIDWAFIKQLFLAQT